ncbi:MAG TPA: NAD(P)H-hydrate dehydratase [Candidatus Thermoplasmatota archaeon]|nr:NAD(P)H-hydrate dehydratase [Candidatus Thermoplasmatota archaeon]
MAGRAGKAGTPQPGYDAAEARRLDLNAAELGVPVERLMANVGKALAKELARHARKGEGVLLLCGKGNNGGDGFAAAAELQAMGRQAWVVLAGPPAAIASAAARAHFARLDRSRITAWTGRPATAWSRVRVVADCLIGSGLAGAPRPPYDAMVRWLDARRRAGAIVVSCDVPSGLGTAIAVRPTATVALHRAQEGLTRSNAGRLVVASIGMPARAADIGFGDLAAGYPGVRHDSHKGDNGTVLVVGGSGALPGAPYYVSLGSYRTGADLVHVATPPAVAAVLRTWSPAPIVHAVGHGRADPGDGDHLAQGGLPSIARLMERCSAVVVGPGLGRHPSTLTATRAVLAEAADRALPTVVDADGLDALDEALLARHGPRMVLTPHAREFQDLAGRAAGRANVVAYAARHGVTVLRKSAVDVVSDGRRTRECRRGHPTLTVGGTGDVLAGITGALLAKGAAPFEAACAASYLLKSAGEVAASLRSYGASASDVAEAIPSVLTRLEAYRAGVSGPA